ncbi:MAG TPA: type III-B CRISPR module RAMP protein Cmr4 [Chloroflexi bacterium]|nr:type III-B CRISPR module RAMP protein Cmr4 [Chloroflexota bacterium]
MSFSTHRYLLMTVDPVHIGTGGTRLGRVDLGITREPGTRLPKIPGTSLSGAIRQYAAYRYNKRRCAGKDNHCGNDACPICYTFGFVKSEGSKQKAHSGVVSIGDARLLLFPVYSMAGPVWVASPSALADFGIEGQNVSADQARWSDITDQPYLNLGWLMVEKEGDLDLGNALPHVPAPTRERVALVSDKLFSQVVNSNLEVRTSVSINPETGAAEDKALFTYEAIPRAAFLWLDVVVDDYRGAFPVTSKQYDQESEQDNAGDNLGQTWSQPAGVVAAGLEWAEHLGIGGMGTRGFGRMRRIAEVQR